MFDDIIISVFEKRFYSINLFSYQLYVYLIQG